MSLEQILPHKKALLEGSAHPRVLSALGPKDPHDFVTRGKDTPPHVQIACAIVFETCSTRVIVVYSCLQLRLIRHEWKQVSKTAHVACKEQSRAGPSTSKQTNYLQAWNKSSPTVTMKGEIHIDVPI